jgi:Cys-tRNA(Pro)/Cys-tRNA(Cys) deacylase
MKKKFPTFVDESALLHEKITVSAGVRGAQLLLCVKELLPFVDAKCVPLTVK